MAHKETNDSKWEGKTSQELQTIKAEELWPLFEDFCNIHKWFPSLDSEKCHHVKGTYAEPGLVRYCAFTEQSTDDENAPTKWCVEKLLSMDRDQHTLSYEVLENNLGFTGCVGKLRVIDIENGCRVEWFVVADPVKGMRLDDWRGFLESSLKHVAEGMRKELLQVDAN